MLTIIVVFFAALCTISGFTLSAGLSRMYALSTHGARPRHDRRRARHGASPRERPPPDGRHQPVAPRRLPAAELPDRPADQPRRLLDRLPRVRRDGDAGRDQGIPAGVAGAAHRGRHRARELGRERHVVPLRDEVLLRGRPRARQDQPPERRARAEFLPRQRDGVHGHALRARAHAAAADPAAPGPDVRAARPAGVHAAAERAARGAHAQAAAPRHQAGEHLPAHRRLAGAARLRRRAADAHDDPPQARADVHAGVRRAGAVPRPRPAGAVDRRLRRRRQHVRLPRGVRAAGRRRARAGGPPRLGEEDLVRASTRTTCSRSSTGACASIRSSGRSRCSRCRRRSATSRRRSASRPSSAASSASCGREIGA